MTVAEKYRELRETLAAMTGEAEAEAREIMAHVYGCSFSSLYLRFSDEYTPDARMDSILQKRLGGMPLAYAMGSKNFYGRDFYVDKNVLIPRHDSESVAEHAIALANRYGYSTALDMCCGSGCLGLTLLLESCVSRLISSDISEGALSVARANSVALAVSKSCVFVRGDLFEHVDGPVDIIICNPPYISADEYAMLDAQVREHEPRQALLADADGYAFYERIIPAAAGYLRRGGAMVLETGCAQAGAVAGMMEACGFINVTVGRDLASRPRFVSGGAA